jgi:putative iron-regulated protein
LRYKSYSLLGLFIAAFACMTVIQPVWAADDKPPPPSRAAPSPQRVLTYRIAGPDRRAYNYDAKAEIQAYAKLAFDSYSATLTGAQYLKNAIDALLANPSDDTLARARDAWVNARRRWEQTEAFRFYDGPIDMADTGIGPIGRLDGWPVDPAAIDYVQDNPTSGIVNNMKQALTRATLLDRQNQTGSGRAVTTGWHAIEFLLWGEQSPVLGDPGDRPPTDYLAGQPNNDRRRAYLKLTADLLIEDLHYLVESWDPKTHNNYAAAFRMLYSREAVGRMMNGVAQLAGQELATGRLAAALDSKDRQFLTSRFSETSYQDFVFALRGISNIWIGDQGGEARPGLAVLVGRVDPAMAQRIFHALDQAEQSVALLNTPLERETLPAPPNAPARQDAERAIADLKKFASLIRDTGVKLGVQVYLPN